ncbi:surface protein sur1 [Nannochloropsis oceanica]
MEASTPVASLLGDCDLQDYVHFFLEDDARQKPVIAEEPSSRRCRACWLDIAKEATFLHQALTEYKYTLRILQGPPASSPNYACIPKILHHIWLGSPFPERFQAFRKTWLKQHPTEDGWSHFLWTDDNIIPLLDSLRNKSAYIAAPDYGQKSDILRYELLHRYGGTYVDVDMECVRSLDLHSEAGPTFYAGFSNTGTVELNNGLIGALPQHPILSSLIERIHTQHFSLPPRPPLLPSEPSTLSSSPSTSPLPSKVPSNFAAILGFLGQGEAAAVKQAVEAGVRNVSSMGTIEATGPGLFTRVVAEHLQLLEEQSVHAGTRDKILLAPPAWFYPMPNHVAHVSVPSSSPSSSSSNVYVLPAVTYTVHHWARSWQQQEQHLHYPSK